MTIVRFIALFAALAAPIGILTGPAVGSAAPAKGALISTATNPLGRILVDAHGRTLYLFEKDLNGKSACAAACAGYWPSLMTTGKPIATAGVKAALLGTTKRSDGRLQVTYNGHPLYTFTLDTKKGQTSGEESNNFGAKWYVVGTNGTKIEKAGSSAYGS
jgi:predicted lipoprotein with Yx(FWY)xxD motif